MKAKSRFSLKKIFFSQIFRLRHIETKVTKQSTLTTLFYLGSPSTIEPRLSRSFDRNRLPGRKPPGQLSVHRTPSKRRERQEETGAAKERRGR